MIFQELAAYLLRITPTWTAVPVLLGALWIASAIYLCFFHHYSDVPGPFWAKVSRLWLFIQVLRGNIDKTQRELHRKYGEDVETNPVEENYLLTICIINRTHCAHRSE